MTTTVAPSTVIRPATLSDVPALVALGLAMAAETAYGRLLGVQADALTALAERLVTGGDDLTLLVTEHDGAVVAMLGLMAYVHPMSGSRIASEACWFVSPSVRGGSLGVRLLRAGEAWARSRGAGALQMIAPTTRVAQLYGALGYTFVETTYMRALA